MVSDNSALDFDDFCDLLIPLEALNSPSELHGFLCGKLCGGVTLSDPQWLEKVWGFLDINEPTDKHAHTEILKLIRTSLSQLGSGHYDLRLLLPNDDTDLDERTQALSQWCYGFLTGFGSAGIDADHEMSGDNADALRDLAAIVQVTMNEQDEEEAQEADYTDLVEYVRIVALNFYAEYRRDTRASVTLH